MKVEVVEKFLTQFKDSYKDTQGRQVCGIEITTVCGDKFTIGTVDTNTKQASKAILNKADEVLALEYTYESTCEKPRVSLIDCAMISNVEIWSTMETGVEFSNEVEIQ